MIELNARIGRGRTDQQWASFVTEDYFNADGVAESWRIVYISPVTFDKHSAAQWHGKKIIKEIRI